MSFSQAGQPSSTLPGSRQDGGLSKISISNVLIIITIISNIITIVIIINIIIIIMGLIQNLSISIFGCQAQNLERKCQRAVTIDALVSVQKPICQCQKVATMSKPGTIAMATLGTS